MHTRGLFILVALALISGTVFGQSKPSYPALQSADQGFIENKGQWDSHAKFLLQKPGLNMWITSDGAVLDAYKVEEKKKKGDVVRMHFAGALPQPEHGLRPLDGYFNYFVGSDKTKWASHVKRYAEVQTGEIYKGIALRYYTDHGSPRYDLIVKPGADPSQVAMKFDGAKSVRVGSDGTLKIKTTIGTIEEKGLVAYQTVNGMKQKVACRMESEGNTACFKTGAYDHSKPLVIDPIIYSSIWYWMNDDAQEINSYGGNANLQNQRIVFDAKGNLIMTGTVAGPNDNLQDVYGATSGSYSQNFIGKFDNTVVCKFDSTGRKLAFSTFFGGTSLQGIGSATTTEGVVVNPDLTISVLGNTEAETFPTTANAYFNRTAANDNLYSDMYCGFIVTFTADGSAIDTCTQFPVPLALLQRDTNGNYWVCGNSWEVSTNVYEAFVAELDSNLTTLKYRYFFGGFPAEMLLRNGQIWISGIAHITGLTGTAFTSGNDFLIDLDPVQDKVVAETDLPGTSSQDFFSGFETAAFAFNPAGNVVAVVSDAQTSLPTSATAFKKTASGSYGATTTIYVAELTPDLKSIVRATYFGGSGSDYPKCFTLDPAGNVIIGGETNSPDFLTTAGAILRQASFGMYAPFISKLSADLSTLQYSSYLPGSGPTTLTFDSTGSLWTFTAEQIRMQSNLVSGSPIDFPITPNAYITAPLDNEYPNLYEKLSLDFGPAYLNVSATGVEGGQPITCTVTMPSPISAALTIPLKVLPVYGTTTITTPASVTIPAGAKIVSFPITTQPTAKTQAATVQFQFPSGLQFVRVNAYPPKVLAVTCTPRYIMGGEAGSATITIDSPAPDGYAVTVNVPGFLSVQGEGSQFSFVFPTGSKTATIDFSALQNASTGNWTDNIYVLEPPQPGYATVASGPITYTAKADPASFTLSQSTITGGGKLTGTITLDGPASAAESIQLGSNNTAVQVPATATLASGASSVSVPVSTSPVTTTQKVTLTATGGGISATATLTVVPTALLSVSATYASMPGNSQQQGAVQLNGLAPASNVGVYLSSSNTGVATVPSSVIVYSGTYHASFTITSQPVSYKTPVTISATYAGVTKTATVAVQPVQGVKSLKFSSSVIIGGQVQTGTLTMSTNAATNINVALSSTNGAIGGIPASVLVPEDSSVATFSNKVQGVSVSTLVTVSASMSGSNVSASFTVVPATLLALSPASSSVSSGKTVACSVYLSGWPPSSGAVVTLSSTSGATVPTSVTVPSGTNHTSFTIQAGSGTTSTQVTITATYAGVSKTTTITVNP